MTDQTVTTWQSPRGDEINITPAQEDRLDGVGVWPKDDTGQEYCQVSHGKHYGTPTYTDSQLEKIVESAVYAYAERTDA